eukprot:TRINITY_DN4149_c0_g1_i2.p1 TRINITY_DN4149_c0_g1~~TRINITY_DN4149_c0_g1_i2.p1  ORF type:complete len:212 (+),score=2.28 TRINITY_DN4149_c0_g1_i2:276-911(+)
MYQIQKKQNTTNNSCPNFYQILIFYFLSYHRKTKKIKSGDNNQKKTRNLGMKQITGRVGQPLDKKIPTISNKQKRIKRELIYTYRLFLLFLPKKQPPGTLPPKKYRYTVNQFKFSINQLAVNCADLVFNLIKKGKKRLHAVNFCLTKIEYLVISQYNFQQYNIIFMTSPQENFLNTIQKFQFVSSSLTNFFTTRSIRFQDLNNFLPHRLFQ